MRPLPRPVLVVDARRTPLAPVNGGLSGWHPADLLARVLADLAERSPALPDLVGEVWVGCGMQVGAQAANVGRAAVVAAGWPMDVGATMVGREEVSGHQALHDACAAVAAGVTDIAIAAAVEMPSAVPWGAALLGGRYGTPWGHAAHAGVEAHGGFVPLPVAAERAATRRGLDRATLDAAADLMRGRATAHPATPDAELVAIEERVRDRGGATDWSTGTALTADRPGPVEPDGPSLLDADGVIASTNWAGPADGAAAVVVASAEAVEANGWMPAAQVTGWYSVDGAPDRALDLIGPAVRAALGPDPDPQVGLELAEPGVVATLAAATDVGIDVARLNAGGGSTALGTSFGAAGTRAAVDLVWRLRRDGLPGGVLASVGAGAVALATAIVTLPPRH